MCLDGAELKFYEYDRDLVELLEAVRGQINEVAETWTREQKDRCLEETMESFKVLIPPPLTPLMQLASLALRPPL